MNKMPSLLPSGPENCSKANWTSIHLCGFQSLHHCMAPFFTHTDWKFRGGQLEDIEGSAPLSFSVHTHLFYGLFVVLEVVHLPPAPLAELLKDLSPPRRRLGRTD